MYPESSFGSFSFPVQVPPSQAPLSSGGASGPGAVAQRLRSPRYPWSFGPLPSVQRSLPAFPSHLFFSFLPLFLYPSQGVSARADGMRGWVRPSRARPRGTMGTVPLSFSPLPLMRALRGGPLFPSFCSGSPCPMMKFPPSL